MDEYCVNCGKPGNEHILITTPNARSDQPTHVWICPTSLFKLGVRIENVESSDRPAPSKKGS